MNIKNDLAKLKEVHEAFGKVLNGEKWEWRICSGDDFPWMNGDDSTALEAFVMRYCNGEARLKPETRKRLVRVEELPTWTVVRHQGFYDCVIEAFYEPKQIVILGNGCQRTIEDLAKEGATYTTDPLRKEWKSFWVEEE